MSTKVEQKKMLLSYPADFVKQLKLAAVSSDRTMKDYIAEAVREKMEREEEQENGATIQSD